jgi:4-diphosphocytidyl-2-C-methyl-D-erythritol kinase
MMSERSAGALAVSAPAKVNMHLEVLGKRPDGYHDLETLMVAVTLEDELELERDNSGVLSLSCDNPDLSCGPDNLVLKAAEHLRQHTGCRNGATIRLVKRIPMQAGLAGGSSDAAATLKGLNRLWQLGLRNERLAEIGAEVGSDVPFFFSPGAAWCTGRGEKVEAVSLGQELDFVLVSPGAGLSTARVFREVSVPKQPVSGDAIRDAVKQGDVEAIGRLLHNRLQEPAKKLCPEVQKVRDALAAAKPAGVLMTGSGTTMFGLCRDRNDAMRVARTMGAEATGSSLPDGEANPSPAGSSGGKWQIRIVRSCQPRLPQNI